MAEENKVAAPAVSDEENEVVTPGDPETSDNSGEDGDPEDGSKQKSHWQAELERIEAEKADAEQKHQAELEEERAERKRLMDIKDKALEKEKEKTSGVKETWKKEVLDEWRREQALKEAKKAVQNLVDDPTAQKVVLHHFQKLPDALVTGDVEEDLQTALALANRKRVTSLLRNESAEDTQARQSISSMGGGYSSNPSFNLPPSATTREATRLASIYAGNDKEKAKRLSQRVNKFGR